MRAPARRGDVHGVASRGELVRGRRAVVPRECRRRGCLARGERARVLRPQPRRARRRDTRRARAVAPQARGASPSSQRAQDPDGGDRHRPCDAARARCTPARQRLAHRSPRTGSAERDTQAARSDRCRHRSAKRRPAESRASFPAIRWNSSTSHGLPYAGRLSGGTQLPARGRELGDLEPRRRSCAERAPPPLRQRAA